MVQPDIAKWGGLTVCRGLADDILKSGKTFCPHYLGGGIGLLASAHLLAGAGGEGRLEMDVNENPLRDYPADRSSISPTARLPSMRSRALE